MNPMPGCTFRATDPRAVWDHVLNSPGLLLGHWVRADGEEVAAVVCTMTQTRRPADIANPNGRAGDAAARSMMPGPASKPRHPHTPQPVELPSTWWSNPDA